MQIQPVRKGLTFRVQNEMVLVIRKIWITDDPENFASANPPSVSRERPASGLRKAEPWAGRKGQLDH